MGQILVVEDNPILSEIWVECLRSEGHTVTRAFTLADLRVAPLSCVDVVLLDWNLSDGSGVDSLPLIAQRSPQAAVVITTGHGEDTVPEGIPGVAYVLRKPFSLRELRQVIASLAS